VPGPNGAPARQPFTFNTVFDVGGRQELGLPDLAGIGADEVARVTWT